jgi:hypothetical protein
MGPADRVDGLMGCWIGIDGSHPTKGMHSKGIDGFLLLIGTHFGRGCSAPADWNTRLMAHRRGWNGILDRMPPFANRNSYFQNRNSHLHRAFWLCTEHRAEAGRRADAGQLGVGFQARRLGGVNRMHLVLFGTHNRTLEPCLVSATERADWEV